jgi:hypothetical protein
MFYALRGEVAVTVRWCRAGVTPTRDLLAAGCHPRARRLARVERIRVGSRFELDARLTQHGRGRSQGGPGLGPLHWH